MPLLTYGNPSDKQRLVLVDLLRGLSIGLVLAIHLRFGRLVMGTSSFKEMHSAPDLWVNLTEKGGYGVSIFFVLSGFLITNILMKAGNGIASISLKEFYVRRAARIFPLLILVCLIGLLLINMADRQAPWSQLCLAAPYRLPSMWASIATFTFNSFRIAHDQPSHPFGVYWAILWSLSIEEQFYLLYPLLVKKVKTLSNLMAILSAIVMMGLVWRWMVFRSQPANYNLSLISTFGAVDQIAIGCLLFFAVRWTSAKKRGFAWAASLSTLGGAGVIAFVLLRTSLYDPLQRVWAPTLLGFGVFLFLWGGLQFTIRRPPLMRLLSLPGHLSYGMYMFHAGVLFLGRPLLTASNPWFAFFVYAWITMIVAFISFYGYEKPVNQWFRGRFLRQSFDPLAQQVSSAARSDKPSSA